MLGVGFAAVALGAVGVVAAWEAKPALTVIVLFYVSVGVGVSLSVVFGLPFVLTNVLEKVLVVHWEGMRHNFPNSWQAYNGTEAVAAVERLVVEQAGPIIVAALFVALSVVQAVVASYLSLTAHVVVRNFQVIAAATLGGVAVVLLGTEAPLHATLTPTISVMSIVPAVLLVVAGTIGVAASVLVSSKEWLLVAYNACGTVSATLLLVGGSVLMHLGGGLNKKAGGSDLSLIHI